jgi:hypothetical protein
MDGIIIHTFNRSELNPSLSLTELPVRLIGIPHINSMWKSAIVIDTLM